MVAGGLAAGEMALPLTNIRTPRAEAAKILESNQGETGSGPKFAGDEDKYFLEGIEEVLAQWEPEVGAMPPVDKKALGLPEQCKLRPIKAKSGQVSARSPALDCISRHARPAWTQRCCPSRQC
mmetsp:Transcript_31508/g.81524  ORF Transcript_31508/g.81524 Transcript_31508/m.81524 type:complete len:123 (+) Transcript_31508:172-540(+)